MLGEIPVDLVPPLLEILQPAGDAVVVQPDVLPRVDAKQRGHVDTAQGFLRLLVTLPRHVAEGACVRICVLRVHVYGLATVVRAADGATGEVCGEDLEGARGAFVGLHEPYEARAEHGIGGVEERLSEGVHGGEVLVDEGQEGVGGLGLDVGVGVEAAEEEVVVEGHGRVVEQGGFHGIAGNVDDEGLDIGVLVFVT